MKLATAASHFGKCGVLLLIDPSGSLASAQAVGTMVSAVWDTGHDLLLDGSTKAQLDALTKRFEEKLKTAAKGFDESEWEKGLTQAQAALQILSSDRLRHARAVASADPEHYIDSAMALSRAISFDNMVQRQAAERAVGVFLAVMRADENTVRAVSLTFLRQIEDRLEKLALESRPAPDIERVLREMQAAWRKARAMSVLQDKALKWDDIAAPAAMLQSEYEIVPLFGREGELYDIERWLDEGQRLRVLIVTGQGGTGKTRLMQEALRRARAGGDWTTGLLSRQSVGNDPGRIGELVANVDRLFVAVDYADTQTEVFNKLIEAVRAHDDCRLRLVLLARGTGWWGDGLFDAFGGEPLLRHVPLEQVI
ncbi:MAG TPA: ATP-binding protein, partial [Rhizobiaceae bacterium]|nr:ATP-binding protein [Rhizobiaceae bacterium]